MLDFRRTDAKRDTAERAIGRGMGIAADHDQARKGNTLLRPYNVDNAMTIIGQIKMHDTEILRMPFQLLHRAMLPIRQQLSIHV